MLNLNEPLLVKKAQIKKCFDMQNDKVLCTKISIFNVA